MNEKSPIPKVSTNATIPTIADEVSRNMSYIDKLHSLNNHFNDILNKFLSYQGNTPIRENYEWEDVPVKERLFICNNDLEKAISELEQLVYKLRTETIG